MIVKGSRWGRRVDQLLPRRNVAKAPTSPRIVSYAAKCPFQAWCRCAGDHALIHAERRRKLRFSYVDQYAVQTASKFGLTGWRCDSPPLVDRYRSETLSNEGML